MRAAFFLAFIILTFNAFGQTGRIGMITSDSTNQGLYTAQSKLLNDRLKATDSALANVLEKQNYLKQENDLFKTTIEMNSNLFTGISTFFTIVSILLTIIVVAIPLINYFLVLKPNQKIVEKVENLEAEVLKTMEGNFEDYFEKLRRKKDTKIIQLLDDRNNLAEVTSYFLLNDSDNLEEQDITKVIDFLKANKDIEKPDATILNIIVIESGFFTAEKYYKSIFENDEEKNFDFAIQYLVRNNFESHIQYIEKIIKANDKGHHLLIKFFDYIENRFIGDFMNKKAPEKIEIGIRYAKLLFDNENILKAIENKEIPKTFGHERHPINTNRLNTNKYLRDTEYYKIYLEEKDKNN